MAASRNLRVGDFVVAIGNPFGLGQTVTSGIVSALERTGVGRGYQSFIQTDASINPGNSGGALVNLRGELVGINSMIFSPSGGNVGIGFAIPSDLAAEVMRQLVAFGEVKRGALGIDTQDITPELLRMLALDTARGAVVTRVRNGSPAAEAGLRPGDVVTSVNGKTIASRQDLHNIEGLSPIGSVLTLGVRRDGQPLTMAVALKAAQVNTARGADLDPRLAGVQLADLAANQRRRGLAGGIAVKNVAQDSRAWSSGLRPGDIIVGVNQRDVEDTDNLADALARRPRQLLLTVVRGQSAFYLLLQ